MSTDNDPLELYLKDVRRQFRALRKQADLALAQVSKQELFRELDAESNSLAVLMKHIAGNLRSRWTDIFTTDGEKPERHRDAEFVIADGETKDVLQAKWEAGWRCLFDTLDSLTADDLGRTILIRNEPHSVIEAINRQLTHYAGHIGQIVFLAKHFAADHWESLSIPRGQSATFNASAQPKRGAVWEGAGEEKSSISLAARGINEIEVFKMKGGTDFSLLPSYNATNRLKSVPLFYNSLRMPIEAASLRERLSTIQEDWERPEMDVYDNIKSE